MPPRLRWSELLLLPHIERRRVVLAEMRMMNGLSRRKIIAHMHAGHDPLLTCFCVCSVYRMWWEENVEVSSCDVGAAPSPHHQPCLRQDLPDHSTCRRQDIPDLNLNCAQHTVHRPSCQCSDRRPPGWQATTTVQHPLPFTHVRHLLTCLAALSMDPALVRYASMSLVQASLRGTQLTLLPF